MCKLLKISINVKIHISIRGLHASFLSSIGPVIRGEPGDVIVVTFRNMASKNFSLQPHGLSYNKLYEGASYEDGKTYRSLVLEIKKVHCKFSPHSPIFLLHFVNAFTYVCISSHQPLQSSKGTVLFL